MLLASTRDGVKKTLGYFSRLPFSKKMLHRLNEIARGRCVAFFSVSRILDDSEEFSDHPHLINKSALTKKQSSQMLSQIKKTLPFVSMAEALELLRGNVNFKSSVAVLLLETPYRMSLTNIIPVLRDLQIPLSLALCPYSLKTGEPPWTDELFFRLLTTPKEEIFPSFIDRSFKLSTPAERLAAANYLSENLKYSSARVFASRLESLRALLHETALLPRSERIASMPELSRLAKNKEISFVMSGLNFSAIFEQNPGEAHELLVKSKEELFYIIKESLIPVLFYPIGLTKYKQKELGKIMLMGGFDASISKSVGLARPGDNMFRLPCLSLDKESPSLSQFELQGLANAIDEFLLVTLAKNEEL